MGFHDAFADIKPEPDAFPFLFGGKKRFEDTVLDFGSYTGSRIDNRNDDPVTGFAGTKGEASLEVHGLCRIADEIEPDLTELVGRPIHLYT